MSSEGETQDGSTYKFFIRRRERYVPVMQNTGYVEDDRWSNPPYKGYYCANCEYFMSSPNTETNFFCRKYKFPDLPWGCCDGFEQA